VVVLLMTACANRGSGPQGGPRDTIPPRVVKEVPLNGSLNVADKKIEITFDEYIQLADIQKNVLISPPQQNPPEIKAIGKTVSVVFQEELQDSTTYTIDFGSAICDYNEKTPLEGYVYAFSTGDVMDSLSISGRVINASNLNAMSSVLVGIHANVHDSAFHSVPFTRVTRTNSEGEFTIHNIRAGRYRIYALNDVSRDYLYQPSEGLAFMDTLIEPYCVSDWHTDTLWRDTIGLSVYGDTLFTRLVDTIVEEEHVRYLPDSLVLWYFEEDKPRLYFQRLLREDQHAFTVVFSGAQDSLPRIEPLRYSEIDTLASDSGWCDFMDYVMIESNATRDTIRYWLTDSMAIRMDTIAFRMTYQYSDSLYNIVPKTDTLMAVYRHPRLSEKALEVYEKNKRERKLELKTNASGKFDIYDTLVISSDYPIDSVFSEKVGLYHKVDTVLQPVPFVLERLDDVGMRIGVIASLKASEAYELKIDSCAFRDIYGVCNDKEDGRIKLKSYDDYSSLVVKLASYDARARIQLLNEKDEVVAEEAISVDGAEFKYLDAKTFYIRMYLDYNMDGQWTTGDWLQHRQSEPVYYYPAKLKLRANWDFEETFDHLALPQTEAKPQVLKGKPKK
jgi:hypothetical protein